MELDTARKNGNLSSKAAAAGKARAAQVRIEVDAKSLVEDCFRRYKNHQNGASYVRLAKRERCIKAHLAYVGDLDDRKEQPQLHKSIYRIDRDDTKNDTNGEQSNPDDKEHPFHNEGPILRTMLVARSVAKESKVRECSHDDVTTRNHDGAPPRRTRQIRGKKAVGKLSLVCNTINSMRG